MKNARLASRQLFGMRCPCQFRLITLFTVVTLSSVFFAYIGNRARRQEEVVRALRSRRASVYESSAMPEWLRLRDWLAPILFTRYEINFWRVHVTQSDIAMLRRLASVDELSIYACDVGDAQVAELCARSSLRVVKIFGPDLTDATLRALAALPNLEVLHVGGPRLTDQGAKHLTQCRRLRELYMGCIDTYHFECGCTLEATKSLAKCSRPFPAQGRAC